MESFESSVLMFISNHQVQLRKFVFNIIGEFSQKFLVISGSVFQTSNNTVSENLIADILSQAKNELNSMQKIFLLLSSNHIIIGAFSLVIQRILELLKRSEAQRCIDTINGISLVQFHGLSIKDFHSLIINTGE